MSTEIYSVVVANEYLVLDRWPNNQLAVFDKDVLFRTCSNFKLAIATNTS
jgi:hypothetical protein